MDLEFTKSDRFRRLVQHGETNFTQQPPQDFVQEILKCVDQWTYDRSLRHKPEGAIYHYCDASGLIGIMKNRKMWATSTKYLNDTTELLSLTANFESHANRYRNGDVEQVLSDIIDYYRVSAPTRQEQVIGMDRYACCFSSVGDLLSQWRAYGNNGRGYAIGFDANQFSGIADTNATMMLRRMTYGGSREAQLVDDLYRRFLPIVARNLHILDNTGWDKQSARNWLSMRFGECLFDLNEEIKDPAFSEEMEWRIYANKNYTVDFRVSQDRIVPYVHLDLSSTNAATKLPVTEIVVGPRLDFREAEAFLMTFTSAIGYGISMDFRKSLVPYR